MGCDIHGTVEYKDCDEWKYVFSIENKLGRNYDMFGLLFGVRNYVNFDPVAAYRGVPDDISLDTWAELDPEEIPRLLGPDYYELLPGYHSYSWITWKELISIDPEMVSLERDQRLHHYKKTATGLEYISKSMSPARLTKEQYVQLEKFYRVDVGDNVYAYEYVKVKNVFNLEHAYKVFRQMAYLASLYGDENVRMVVGFDS